MASKSVIGVGIHVTLNIYCKKKNNNNNNNTTKLPDLGFSFLSSSSATERTPVKLKYKSKLVLECQLPYSFQ